MAVVARLFFLVGLIVTGYLLNENQLSEQQTSVLIVFMFPLGWGVLAGFTKQFDKDWAASKLFFLVLSATLIIIPFILTQHVILMSDAETKATEKYILGERLDGSEVWLSWQAGLENLKAVGTPPQWMASVLAALPTFLSLFALPLLLSFMDRRWLTFLKLCSGLAPLAVLMQIGVVTSAPYMGYVEPIKVEDCYGSYAQTESEVESGFRDELVWEDDDVVVETNYYHEVTEIGKNFDFHQVYDFTYNCTGEAITSPEGWKKSCDSFTRCISIVNHNQKKLVGDLQLLDRSKVEGFIK